MMNQDDMALVREFAASQSEPAFTALVQRHVGLVHSAALRRVGDPHLAEEVTQAVFILLARKAGTFGSNTILSGWLYRTTGYVAADALKRQRRREHREQEAYMQSTLNEPETPMWRDISPLLESAMDALNERDRNAVLLRFFEDKTLGEVAAAAGVSEDAARVRVNRALEKLHHYFARHGVSSTTAMLAGAISSHSVQTVPAALTTAVTVAALAKGASASISTLTLIKGALQIMVWTKAKTAVVAGVVVLLAAGTAVPIIAHHSHSKSEQAMASLFTSKTELSDSDNANYQKLTGTTPTEVAQKFFDQCAQNNWSDARQYYQVDARDKNSPASFSDGFRRRYGGLQIISVGKPFKARISIAALVALQPEARKQFRDISGDIPAGGVFVPYEMRLNDGSIRKWQLSIRCDNPENRWYYDGGM